MYIDQCRYLLTYFGYLYSVAIVIKCTFIHVLCKMAYVKFKVLLFIFPNKYIIPSIYENICSIANNEADEYLLKHVSEKFQMIGIELWQLCSLQYVKRRG